MHRIEIPQDPRHLGVPSGASRMISEPMVRSTQTVHLTYVKVSTITKRTENELPLEPCHLGVPSSASKMIPEPMVHLAQTVHQSRTDTNTVPKRTKTSLHMTHVTLEFHRVRPKQFLSPCYVQRKPCTYLASRLALSLEHLSCVKISIISK